VGTDAVAGKGLRGVEASRRRVGGGRAVFASGGRTGWERGYPLSEVGVGGCQGSEGSGRAGSGKFATAGLSVSVKVKSS
jgi:hypothetical protein